MSNFRRKYRHIGGKSKIIHLHLLLKVFVKNRTTLQKKGRINNGVIIPDFVLTESQCDVLPDVHLSIEVYNEIIAPDRTAVADYVV